MAPLTNGFKFDSAGDRCGQKVKCQPACKPGSVHGGFPPLDDHSSGTPVAGRFTRPTRMTGPETALKPPRGALASSLFGLAPGGVCLGRRRCRKRGALLPHLFNLAPGRTRFAVCFCGTVPGVAPAGRYPAPYFHGARTFLPRTLSGLAAAVIQPAGRCGGRLRTRRSQRNWAVTGCVSTEQWFCRGINRMASKQWPSPLQEQESAGCRISASISCAALSILRSVC